MDITMLDMVNRIAEARQECLNQLRQVQDAKAPGINITINTPVRSWRQDEAMVALVRPVIERELRARITSLDADLEGLGVQVD